MFRSSWWTSTNLKMTRLVEIDEEKFERDSTYGGKCTEDRLLVRLDGERLGSLKYHSVTCNQTKFKFAWFVTYGHCWDVTAHCIDDLSESNNDLLCGVSWEFLGRWCEWDKRTGNGPWPIRKSGPLRRLMLLAGACRAWDWPVMILMFETIWEAVIWA